MLGTWHGVWLMVGDELSIYQFVVMFWEWEQSVQPPISTDKCEEWPAKVCEARLLRTKGS